MDRYNPENVKQLVKKIAVKAGVPESDAIIFADSLVEADIAGTPTHGISRCDIYIRRIQKGLIDPKAMLEIESTRSSVMVVNAGNGLGQVQAVKVLDKLIKKAKETGLSLATIKNSQHFGTLSYYCNRAADANMILLATTNCEPSMSPAGGCQAYFGTNPLGVSFPTGKGFHVKVDLATSLVARGNIIDANKRGEDIPEGWAQDVDGNPTKDAGKALLGTVLTMAGHKGYALALAAEVLSGVLSGSAVGPSIGSMYKNFDRKQDVGHFFCLIDIEALMDVDQFKFRIDSMIDEIKGCRKQSGIDEIFVPGERSAKNIVSNRKKGIKIGKETLKELKTLCEEFKILFNLNSYP